jgi:single-strand DNA-binding protein
MSGSVNKVILIGNLGRDPEVRRTQAGDPVVSFSLATSESWRDKETGERKEIVNWHNVVIFNDGLCKVAEQYAKKGSKVYVECQMQTREYTDRDGNQRRAIEVVLKQFRGEFHLLERIDRPAPEQSEYGKETTRQPAQQRHQTYDDDRMAMGHSGGDFGRQSQRVADMIDDDIPF